MTVGTIKKLHAVTSGNHQYDGYVLPIVNQQKVTGYAIQDPINGGIQGNNAVITGAPATGNGIISTVVLQSSGYGFNTDQQQIQVINQSNSLVNPSYLTINVSAIGYESGQWLDTSGFLNSDKYIEDSYYYQQFSYEIQIEKSIDKYISVLKQVMHPTGNKVFGLPVITDTNNIAFTIAYEETSKANTKTTVVSYP
jgi:hypothetical protein